MSICAKFHTFVPICAMVQLTALTTWVVHTGAEWIGTTGLRFFICTPLVRIAEPNWSGEVGAIVHSWPNRTSLGSEPYGSALVCTGP